MALFDLSTELEKPSFKLDESSQRQVCDTVLKLLDDTNAEVQSQAVKCLSPLVRKMSKQQIEDCVYTLSKNLLEGDESKRDVASMSLKIIIQKLPAEIAPGPIKNCLDKLLQTLQGKNTEVKAEALDILTEILTRFGSVVQNRHNELQSSFINELESGKAAIRKRAISCLAALSVHTKDNLFNSLLEKILDGIKKSFEGGEALRTNIQCASAISKTAGHRLGKFLDKIFPLLLKTAEAISEKEEEDEVRENIMQAFESFVLSCPDEIKNYIEFVIILGKEYVEYDPNYSYDSSDEEAVEEEEEDNDEEGSDGEGEISDDDDVSWKVRKAAARTLAAVVKTRPEMLEQIYKDLCSVEEHTLVSRFKEREESVKIDIFNVFIALLQQTIITTTDASGALIVKQKPEIKYLQETKDIIMQRIKKQLKEKSIKVKTHIFKVLREFVIALQGGLEKYANFLIPAIKNALTDKKSNSTLKLEALGFLQYLLSTHSGEAFKDHIDTLSSSVYEVLKDKYYKLISQSLKVCGELVKVVATLKGTDKFEKHVQSLFNTVYEKLIIQDIDQDVKESAIDAMGRIISQLGSSLGKDLNKVLPVLLDRLKNEITRLTACKTFNLIAKSDQNIDLKSVLSGVVQELASYLRKNNRTLRQASLTTLSTLTTSKHEIEQKLLTTVISEVASLLHFTSDKDLHLTHLALELCVHIITSNSKSVSDVQKEILPKALELLKSSTLQGLALESLLKLFQMLVPTVGFNNLFNSVTGTLKKAEKPISKQVYTNIAKSVAALIQKSSEKDSKSAIEKFAKDLKSTDETTKMLALYALGEIGLTVDLGSYGTIQKDIQACFDETEEIKNAASISLGNVAVGNLSQYLPFIINEIRNQSKHKYQLIHSLKEIITQAPADKLKPFIKDLLPLLFEHCNSEEEGVRNVVSECLGKLAIVDYDTIIEQLKKALSDGSEKTKSTVVSAVKYTIQEKPRDYDSKLKNDIKIFLEKLRRNEDVSVRRSAVLLLTSAIHNKPRLVEDNLDALLPHLYAECVIDKSLITTVNLGPFTHKVDRGEDLRKSTFECMDTLLDTCLNRIDPNKFISNLIHGLQDTNADIKMLAHIMIQKLSEKAPNSVLTAVDNLVDPIQKILNEKLKENAVQTEKERHTELIRSALRAVYAISNIPGIQDNVKFNELITKTIKATSSLNTLYEQIIGIEQEQQ